MTVWGDWMIRCHLLAIMSISRGPVVFASNVTVFDPGSLYVGYDIFDVWVHFCKTFIHDLTLGDLFFRKLLIRVVLINDAFVMKRFVLSWINPAGLSNANQCIYSMFLILKRQLALTEQLFHLHASEMRPVESDLVPIIELNSSWPFIPVLHFIWPDRKVSFVLIVPIDFPFLLVIFKQEVIDWGVMRCLLRVNMTRVIVCLALNRALVCLSYHRVKGLLESDAVSDPTDS